MGCPGLQEISVSCQRFWGSCSVCVCMCVTAPLAWESRGAQWRSRGSSRRQLPSSPAGAGEHGGPCGTGAGDAPTPGGPGGGGWLQTVGCSSGSGCVRESHCPSCALPSSSSWLASACPPATWCHSGRTPGFSVTGTRIRGACIKPRMGHSFFQASPPGPGPHQPSHNIQAGFSLQHGGWEIGGHPLLSRTPGSITAK